MEKDSKNPTVEQLQRQLEAMKAQYESKLAAKESEIGLLKEELASQEKQIRRNKEEIKRNKEEIKQRKKEIDQYTKLTAWLSYVLGEIVRQRKVMLTDAMQYVVNFDEPLAKDLLRLVRATVRKMAAFARSVSRARPERKIGGESISISRSGTPEENTSEENTAAKNTTGENNFKADPNADMDMDMDSEIEAAAEIDEAELQSIPAKPAKAMTLLMGRLDKLVGKFKLTDESLAVLAANASDHADIALPTARGRKINMPTLTRLDKPDEIAVTKCPKCGTPIEAVNPETQERIVEDLGVMIDMVKTVRTNLTAMRGGSIKLGYHSYRCTRCGTIFSGRPENADHPFCPGREISTNSALEIGYGQSLGFSINAAGKDFEKNAKLGSNTVSLILNDIGKYVMKPVCAVLKNILAQQHAVGADGTPFAIKQAMGLGRMPLNKRPQMPLSSLTYILAVGSMRRSPVRIELYIPLMGRGADLIAQALRDLNFKVLSSDGYAGYNKTLLEHPDALHQICLVHWRRGLMDNAYDSHLVKDCLKLPPKKQEKYLLAQFEKKSPLYLILIIFRAISHIYGHERSIDDLEPDSPEIEAYVQSGFGLTVWVKQ